MDTVRVLRVVEYVGPRDVVEEQIGGSLKDGTHSGFMMGNVKIKVATIGDFPEILEKEVASEKYCQECGTILCEDNTRDEDQDICEECMYNDCSILVDAPISRRQLETPDITFEVTNK